MLKGLYYIVNPCKLIELGKSCFSILYTLSLEYYTERSEAYFIFIIREFYIPNFILFDLQLFLFLDE